MNTSRPCGCKSFRSCRVCEAALGLPEAADPGELDNRQVWRYDLDKGRCVNKGGEEREFPGILVLRDFITLEEEAGLVAGLDGLPWDSSQSGRRKQNFGPRANFKKRKAKVGGFRGFPAVSRLVQERFGGVAVLEDYRAVEQCSIEYRPETGASIEPHIDDCWIWGERIVQLNTLSSTLLTLNPYTEGEKPKYNLQDVATYPRVVGEEGEVAFNPFKDKLSSSPFPVAPADWPSTSLVQVPLPPRSLLVMWGEARYGWEHAVRRQDIGGRRVVVAYRELTPTYLPGGVEEAVGEAILQQAALWWPSPVSE